MPKPKNEAIPLGPFPALLDIAEIAVYLNIPIKAVYGLVQTSHFPAFKIGKHWRVHLIELNQWAREHSRDRIDAPLTA